MQNQENKKRGKSSEPGEASPINLDDNPSLRQKAIILLESFHILILAVGHNFYHLLPFAKSQAPSLTHPSFLLFFCSYPFSLSTHLHFIAYNPVTGHTGSIVISLNPTKTHQNPRRKFSQCIAGTKVLDWLVARSQKKSSLHASLAHRRRQTTHQAHTQNGKVH
jgi:hypothetical protein